MTYCMIGDMATRVAARDLMVYEFETRCFVTFVEVLLGGKFLNLWGQARRDDNLGCDNRNPEVVCYLIFYVGETY